MKVVKILFLIYLLIFPFGQLARLSTSSFGLPEINIYLTDILAGLLVFIWFVGHLFLRKKTIIPKLSKTIFIFISISLLSLLVNSFRLSAKELLISLLYLVRWVAYAGLYFVGRDLFKNDSRIKKSSKLTVLLALGTSVAIFGFVQYYFWPDLTSLGVYQWDPHFYRLVSTFLDPGFTGIILVLSLIAMFYLYWDDFYKKKSPFTTHYSLFAILYIALALTYSRSSYLAYLIGMGVIAWWKKSINFLLIIVLLGVLTLIVIPQPAGEGGRLNRQYSIKARVESWQHALTVSRDHLIFGVGFNAYRFAQRDYGFLDQSKWQKSHSGAGSDSSLLFVLATTGIFGLIAFAWIWFKAVAEGKNWLVTASIAAIFVHSFFLNSLFYPWVMAWLWILLAIEEKN